MTTGDTERHTVLRRPVPPGKQFNWFYLLSAEIIIIERWVKRRTFFMSDDKLSALLTALQDKPTKLCNRRAIDQSYHRFTDNGTQKIDY